MDVKSITHSVFWGVVAVLAFVVCTPFNINAMPDSRVMVKNITKSNGILEVNPRFVGDGSNIVFLEYQNTSEDVLPWDYRLVMCDRNGYHFNYLTETGVLDYEVMPGGMEVRYLLSTETGIDEVFDEYTYYNQIDEWELWQLDLKSDAHKLLEKSHGRPLTEGYKLLGGRGLPDYYEGKSTTYSPSGNNVILMQIEDDRVNFYKTENGSKRLLHSSDHYKTHGHIPWLPQIVWQNENSFLTLDYQSANNFFRVISVDLIKNKTEIVYQHEKIMAFPRMNLDEFGTMLYFVQKGEHDGSELWRIELNDEPYAQFIYADDSQIGTAFPSVDGQSIVFSVVEKNNFDIIRLDFGSSKIQRLTAN